MVATTKRKRKVRPKDLPPGLRAAKPTSPGARARATGQPCTRCQQHHIDRFGESGCSGHVRQGPRKGQPCTSPTLNGQDVCGSHGGNLPQNKAKAEARILWMEVDGEVGALLRECDLPEQHPIDGLLEVVRTSGAMMRLLGSLCAQLDLDPGDVKLSFDDNGNVTKYTEGDAGIYGYNTRGDQATHILVTMWGQWADRYARACKLALDANIDERLVRNAEATSNAVFIAVERALQSADLNPQQAALFSKTLAGELRKLVSPLDSLKQGEVSK